MFSRTTHPSLLARLRNVDDRGAWQEFEDRYGEMILRYCRRQGLQHNDAEDVRQLVFLNLSRAFPTFEYQPTKGRFRHYLGQVVRNAIHRLFRSPRTRPNGPERRLESSILATAAAEEALEDDDWEEEWVQHHFRLAMRTVRVSFEERSLRMFDRILRGTSIADVAHEFETTQQAVHKVKQRVRNRLRELIEEQVREEDESL